MKRPGWLLLVATIVTASCSGAPGANDDATTAGPSSPPPSNASDASASANDGASDAGPPPDCAGVAPRCDAWNVRAHCVAAPSGPTWVTETCPAGCFAGACSASACADECVLGASCELWDMRSGAFVAPDPAGKLHDRARDYDRILRTTDLPEGQVMNARYTDATRTTIARYDGYHDAAIWTGTALAAQALRLFATREPDAAAEVAALVDTLHRDLTVSGDPGYLARAVVRSGAGGTPLTDPTHCADPEFHCGVGYQGTTVDWLGATSRDQYTGVVLGYALAYAATSDEAVKKTIRADLVTLATELVKARPSVPASIVVNGIPLQKDLALENVVLVPSEMVSGRVTIELSTSSTSDAHILGLREFFPDYSVLAKQVLGLGVAIPRPSTTIILGAILRAAIDVSADDPSMKAAHDTIRNYYASHAAAWLDIAAGWTFDPNCGNGYFANHLAVIMAYTWASRETDAVLLPRIRDAVFDAALFAALGGHKNADFSYLWAGTRASPRKDVVDAAGAQLAQFTPGPRVHVARANTSDPRYMPHDSKCTAPILCDTATLAVDVGDRVVDDFLRQRQPWQLGDGGDPLQVYPGVDYLAAYWAGRRHGFLADDREGTCARHAP